MWQFLATVLIVLLIYNGCITYEAFQYANNRKKVFFKMVILIWLIPFIGAYLANKKMGFIADENLLINDTGIIDNSGLNVRNHSNHDL